MKNTASISSCLSKLYLFTLRLVLKYAFLFEKEVVINFLSIKENILQMKYSTLFFS